MKSHKLLLVSALLALSPWQPGTAQTSQTTLVAQAAPPPSMPMPTADEKMAPANAIREPVPGVESQGKKKMPTPEETTGTPRPKSNDSNAAPRRGEDAPDGGKRGGQHSGQGGRQSSGGS
ncbi:hypothetical protein [Achromobacter spanius]|uniref:hypothetical protein n=1 Tax=Achromobacter spanius TaxID=217203 RepID=UPI003A931702